MAAVGLHLVSGIGVVGADLALLDQAVGSGVSPAGLLRSVPPPPAGLEATDLGALYESLLDADARHSTGVHYTPAWLCRTLVDLTLGPGGSGGDVVVWDPACGAGAFLLAACRALVERGTPVGVAVRAMSGTDVDPHALLVADASLRLWAASMGERVVVGPHLSAGDALLDGPPSHPLGAPTAVVGNPPFLDQLDRRTAMGDDRRRLLRDRYGDCVRAYVDESALFLVAGLRAVTPDGAVCLVLPQSFLGARDGAGVRAEALRLGALRAMWVGEGRPFRAAVRVCAPVLSRSATCVQARVDVHRGSASATVVRAADVPLGTSWAPLLGVGSETRRRPRRGDRPEAAGLVGDAATATAGFRDQYYGFVDLVREQRGAVVGPMDGEAAGHGGAGPLARLATVGLVDPAEVAWGLRPARFAKADWTRPVVDLDDLAAQAPRLHRWSLDRLRPKVLVATQTKAIEAAVDEHGRYLPITPLVSVHPDPGMGTWHLAAALSAPSSTAMAHRLHGGTGLSAATLRVTARQLLDLPLPAHQGPWNEAAELAEQAHRSATTAGRRAALLEMGAAMCRAFGVDPADGTLAWWSALLPERGRPERTAPGSARPTARRVDPPARRTERQPV